MQWITNTIKPRLVTINNIKVLIGEPPEQTYTNWLNWLSDKTIGLPKATKQHSVEELIRKKHGRDIYK